MTSFRVRTENRLPEHQDGAIYILEDGEGKTRASIWAALGFNCFQWLLWDEEKQADLLFADSRLFQDRVPTRSGIPVLFPFPNRIRDGRFLWEGKSYQLPINDSSKKNSIHGFACRRPWRILEQGAGETEAWITGEFLGSKDAPGLRSLWPADYRLQLTYRLRKYSLAIEATVYNPDCTPLPFGLGFHPYFRLPAFAEDKSGDSRVRVNAPFFWELIDSLPTGRKEPARGDKDLANGKDFEKLQMDDVFTGLETPAENSFSSLRKMAEVSYHTRGKLSLWASPDFEELVVFTPPHRQAICLEPYTCVTDAINLRERGLQSGWEVLAPGNSWRGIVELVFEK